MDATEELLLKKALLEAVLMDLEVAAEEPIVELEVILAANTLCLYSIVLFWILRQVLT